MKYFGDLTLGRVVHFDARPDKLFGFIQELNPENGEPTGNPNIWFHYNDGQFVRPWHLDREVAWDGFILGTSRLRLPMADDFVVYEDPAPGRDGRLKAARWTFMTGFYASCVDISTQSYRIVDGDTSAAYPAIVWEGALDSQYGTRLSGHWGLPKELKPDLTVQQWRPEDIHNSSDGSSGIIHGYWQTAKDQEKIWLLLVEASKRPPENSRLPPALRRRKVSA